MQREKVLVGKDKNKHLHHLALQLPGVKVAKTNLVSLILKFSYFYLLSIDLTKKLAAMVT